MTSLYLIAPKAAVEMYYDAGPGWVSSADLAIVTIAAMAPPHWAVTLTEEAISPVDYDTPARFVGLTGKTAHLERVAELSCEFRRRGKVVLVGGPFASLEPEAVRPHADILVTGEMEDIASQLFADLESGDWRDHYDGGRADIRRSPIPAWHLYPVERAMLGALQTTRGCPFDCEFCDVIQYQGRKQRHKDVTQVVSELDVLHAAGFREVFLSDDNFSVHRQFARTMLDAIADWNSRRTDAPMRFITQASLDIARDRDLLKRCYAAGLHKLFVGIETINEASLRETNKKQNLLMPMKQSLETIVSHGIAIRGGVIVGFDHDEPGIFSDLFDFFQKSPVPDLTVNLLNASKGTPLYVRMKREGRLLEGRWEGALRGTNIVPKLMTREQLIEGARAVTADLFAASAFERRMMSFIDAFEGACSAGPKRTPAGERGRVMMGRLHRVSTLGGAEKRMLSRVLEAASAKPATFPGVVTALMHFERIRCAFDELGMRVKSGDSRDAA